MTYKEKIKDLFSKGDGRVIDLFYEVFCYILSLENSEQIDVVQYVCEKAKTFGTDDENNIKIRKYYTEEKFIKCLNNAEKFKLKAKELVYDSSKNNVSMIDFYEQFWDMLTSNRICKNRYEKALALFFVVDSDLVPYHAVGVGLSMDDSLFATILTERIEPLMNDVDMILRIDYDEKTQRASLLVDKLLSLETIEQKSVFMAILIDKLDDIFKEKLDKYINNS